MTQLIHFPVDAAAFGRWSGRRALTIGGAFDPGHACHVLLSALFGKAAFQPFRLFAPQRGDWSIYGVSQQSLEELQATANMVAPPEMLGILDMVGARSKTLPESFAQGLRIGFDITMSPTRRKGSSERDAFTCEALHRFPESPDGMRNAGIGREDVYRKWFAEKILGAADLEIFRMVSYQRRVMIRSGSKVHGPEAIFQGTLRVLDPVAFGAIVHAGLGRGRAYGYGLMLLRPADAKVSF